MFRIRIRTSLGLLDLDPLVRGTDPDPDSPVNKNSKKPLDFYYFVTSLCMTFICEE
jgi:hypothetical protein